MILETGIHPARGEALGRVLIAETLAYRRLYKAGEHEAPFPAAATGRTSHEIAAACLWLKEAAGLTAAALKLDPTLIKPAADQREQPAWAVWRSWELSHAFLAECWPWLPGGVEMCCRECLEMLAYSLSSSAAAFAEMDFHRQGRDAEAYIRDGGPLPAHGHIRGCQDPGKCIRVPIP